MKINFAPSVLKSVTASQRTLFVLGFSGLICLTNSAPAKATRPVVTTSMALKNLKLSFPVPTSEVTEKGIVGLDREGVELRQQTLAQAKEYIAFRSGRMTNNQSKKWQSQCEKERATPLRVANPYCHYEGLRLSGVNHSPANKASQLTEVRNEIAKNIKDGKFAQVASRDYIEVVRGVSTFANSDAVIPLATKILDQDCPPATLSTAVAYKLEESFPAQDVVETAKKLYRQASTCGNDFAAAKASFRLGLILIWQKNCADVKSLMSKVEANNEASQYHPRARYWRHHCAIALGQTEEKRDIQDALLKKHLFSFHNLAVNGEREDFLKQLLKVDASQVSMRSLIRPDLNSILRGAEALSHAGSNHLAAELLDRSVGEVRTLEPEVRLYAAALLSRMGYALPKFKILSQLFNDSPRMVSEQTLRLFFPLWYFDLLKVKQADIDPFLILSLIRQESAFNAGARSVVGARGLMQVMPATARSISSVRTEKLFDPRTNIKVGTKYFLKRLSQYGGDVELTLAAYNAGFSRVDQWVKRYPTDNKMLFLDLIPFRETREYVTSILRNYYWYVKLYGPDTATAEVENAKIKPTVSKTSAILNANAGLAAQLTHQK